MKKRKIKSGATLPIPVKAVWVIAQKEFRDSFRDKRLWWASSFLLVLLCASFIIGLNYSKARNKAREEAQVAQREQWINKSVTNSHIAAHTGITLFRPNSLLLAIDNGLDNYLGTSVFVEPHRRNLFQQAPVENVPALQQLGELTPAFALQIIVPLIIVLLCFSTFTAEREQGTLRIMLAHGVKPSDLALGKLIGSMIPLISVLMLVITAGTASMLINSSEEAGEFSLPRFSFMVFGYLAYYIIFIGISVAVSALSKTSQRSFLVLLGFWFFACLIVPRVIISIAQKTYPIPTAEQFIKELEQAETKVLPFMAQRAAIEKELMATYRVSKPTDLPVSTWGVTLFRREEESTRLYNQQFGNLFTQYEKQNSFYQFFSFLAPSISIQMYSMSLSGSDLNHFRHFAEVADNYRYEMVQQMNQIAIESKLYNASLSAPPDHPAFPKGEKEAYKKVKPFNYMMPSYSWALEKTMLSTIALLVWLAVSIFFLRRVLLKIKVL